MKGIVATFARHPVLSNLVMIGVLVSGAVATILMNTELFPEFSLDMISVTVVYPQASPSEVEDSVVKLVEDAIQGTAGVKQISATASDGVGTVMVELENTADPREVQDEIRNAVDRIDNFPDDAEEPIVKKLIMRREVIRLAVYGDAPERTLKEVAQDIRDELLALSGPTRTGRFKELFSPSDGERPRSSISQVDLLGVRDYRIVIEISEQALRRRGLTFDEVASAVRGSSLNIPAGTLRGENVERRLTIEGRKYTADQYEDILLMTQPGGARIYLGDVAEVRDTFEEDPRIVRFNGKPAVVLNIQKTSEQDAIAIADTVKWYVGQKQGQLPPGIHLEPWADRSKFIEDRLNLLINNGSVGLILVVLSLWLFLNFRLSFWVALGIPIAFAGGLTLMYLTGQSLNMMSMFALIMATGLIVDDAIIIGENVYQFMRKGYPPAQAAIKATQQVAFPVIVTVVTTIVAFAPLLFVPGVFGKFMRVLPMTLIATLSASLIEAFLILPAHLSHTRPATFCEGKKSWACRVRRKVDGAIEWVIQDLYRPFFRRALRYRMVTFATALAALLLCLGLWLGGLVKWEVFPDIDSDVITAEVTFPYGTPASVTTRAVQRLERAAFRLNDEYSDRIEGELVTNMSSSIGESSGAQAEVGRHAGDVIVELAPAERRGELSSKEIVNRWRELVGPIPGTTALNFGSRRGGPGGKPIEVRLRSRDIDRLQTASAWVRSRLETYPGVKDLSDDFRLGPTEIRIEELKPAGEALGLTLEQVGRQLMSGFFGAEPVRIQRGRDDVKVKVRYPLAERRSPADIEAVRIRTATGAEVPIERVARIETGREPAVIHRQDRLRVINVRGDIDTKINTAAEVLAGFRQTDMADFKRAFPRVFVSFEGRQQEGRDALSSLFITYPIAMLTIYLLLAGQFGTYFQPIIIMLAIPFGIVGAVLGHLVLGLSITLLSVFGIVAVSGVVVNDALVLVEFVHIGMREGKGVFQAVFDAGPARFRAIMLTTLTTVAGLLPIIVERSMQAQFLIPMAVAISGGLIVATALNLLVTPSLYLLTSDVRRLLYWARHGLWPTREEVEPELRRRKREKAETAPPPLPGESRPEPTD